jgi:DNA-repair protein complementing XP-A cells
MSDSTTVRKPLTEEQRRKIDENKQAALERRAASKKRAAAEQNDSTGHKKAKRSQFYEYDLSTFENTKGGFIVDPVTEEKVNRFREQATKIEPMLRK